MGGCQPATTNGSAPAHCASATAAHAVAPTTCPASSVTGASLVRVRARAKSGAARPSASASSDGSGAARPATTNPSIHVAASQRADADTRTDGSGRSAIVAITSQISFGSEKGRSRPGHTASGSIARHAAPNSGRIVAFFTSSHVRLTAICRAGVATVGRDGRAAVARPAGSSPPARRAGRGARATPAHVARPSRPTRDPQTLVG